LKEKNMSRKMRKIDATPFLPIRPADTDYLCRTTILALFLTPIEVKYLIWVFCTDDNWVRSRLRVAMGEPGRKFFIGTLYHSRTTGREVWFEPKKMTITREPDLRDEGDAYVQYLPIQLTAMEDAFLDELSMRWGLARGEIVAEWLRESKGGKKRDWLEYPFPRP
jgi:hypothetical protein